VSLHERSESPAEEIIDRSISAEREKANASTFEEIVFPNVPRV
jgi:hypothetical protein